MLRPRPATTIWKLALLCAALWGCDQPTSLAWRWAGNGPSRSGLLPIKDGVILGNEAGTLVRLGSDGKVVWRVSVGREVAARPAVVGGTVVAATINGDWVGLSLESGEQRWRLAGKPPLVLPLASDGTRAFALASDGSVSAVSGANGGTAWKLLPPRGLNGELQLTAPPVAHDGRVFVALGSAGLLALDPEAGDTLWRREGAFSGLHAEGDRLYAVSRDGRLVALSTADGAVQWEKQLDVKVESGPSAAHGWLWLGTENAGLLAVDSKDGAERWRITLSGPLRGGVEAYRDVVLVPTSGREGRLLAFSPGKAKPVFELRVDSPLRTAPRVFGDTVVVQAMDGRVLAYAIKRTTK